jgi:autotransporter-associated beta strand protein
LSATVAWKFSNFLLNAGKIVGTTGIEKDGAGSLTISRANDFTGPVIINNGTLIGSTSKWGSSNGL